MSLDGSNERTHNIVLATQDKMIQIYSAFNLGVDNVSFATTPLSLYVCMYVCKVQTYFKLEYAYTESSRSYVVSIHRSAYVHTYIHKPNLKVTVRMYVCMC